MAVTVGNFGSNAVVNAGTGGGHRYPLPEDTPVFHPGTLTVNVIEMTGAPVTETYVEGSVHGTITIVLGGSFLGTDTPVQVTPDESDLIILNSIGDRSVGDQFLITGTTRLPVGTTLPRQIMPETGITPTGVNQTAIDLGGSNMVTKGSGTTNRVSFDADMNQMPAGKWAVLVGVMKDDDFEVKNPDRHHVLYCSLGCVCTPREDTLPFFPGDGLTGTDRYGDAKEHRLGRSCLPYPQERYAGYSLCVLG